MNGDDLFIKLVNFEQDGLDRLKGASFEDQWIVGIKILRKLNILKAE